MKILTLQAENIKKLKLVRLELDGENLVVSGPPGEGKTTLIDLVWMCLESKVVPSQPVTVGKTKGSIEVVIGDNEIEGARKIRVKRSFSASGSRLTAESTDGKKIGVKDVQALMEVLSFDPLDFFRKKNKEQVDMLMRLLNLDFTELDINREQLYAARTLITRDMKRLEGQATTPPAKTEMVDASKIMAELNEAIEHNQGVRETKEHLYKLEEERDQVCQDVIELTKRLAELKDKETTLASRIAKGRAIVEEMAFMDEAAISEKLNSLEEVNNRARAYKEWEKIYAEYQGLEKEQSEHTEAIAGIDEKKKEAVKAAKWPVDGLWISPEGIVMFGDVPLEQYGESKKLEISFAIASSTSPELRICRIDGAESLGVSGRNAIFQLAKENDMQVFMSRVSDAGQDDGEIVIEEGVVSK